MTARRAARVVGRLPLCCCRAGRLRARRRLGRYAAPTAAADACSKDKLALKTAGTFTVGTDKPAYEPWFSSDDPANGKGYESAVTYAVAEKLGFAKAEVKWQTVQFNAAFAPGPKKFDVDVNQVSISEDRRKAVDFSTGYYDVRQTVITTAGSKIANATSVAELADAKLGAQVGTTSYTVAERRDQAEAAAGRVRHQRPGRAGAEEQADRRHRGGPADRRST